MPIKRRLVPMGTGALDAEGKGKDMGKGKAQDKPGIEMACCFCRKLGPTAGVWHAARKDKEKRRSPHSRA